MIKMLRFMALSLVMCFAFTTFAGAALLEEVTPLAKKQIDALTDDQLLDSYVNTLVDMDAVKMFHSTSGFTPKEYQNYKDLLKNRLLLLFEIHKRKLGLPPSVE